MKDVAEWLATNLDVEVWPGFDIVWGRRVARGVEDLRQNWTTLDLRWTNYLASLTPESLEDVVQRKSSSTGQRFGTKRSDVLLHVCTHAHYTAAQVINMLRQAGLNKLPETMLISMARQEATEIGAA